MPLAREQRKLAAILAADVVGYSRLMGRDESGTLALLRKNRSEHLDPVLKKYGGRLVKLTGDGALIEFASAVDALSAAIEFQRAMAEANGDQPKDDALVFRRALTVTISAWRQRHPFRLEHSPQPRSQVKRRPPPCPMLART